MDHIFKPSGVEVSYFFSVGHVPRLDFWTPKQSCFQVLTPTPDVTPALGKLIDTCTPDIFFEEIDWGRFTLLAIPTPAPV